MFDANREEQEEALLVWEMLPVRFVKCIDKSRDLSDERTGSSLVYTSWPVQLIINPSLQAGSLGSTLLIIGTSTGYGDGFEQAGTMKDPL